MAQLQLYVDDNTRTRMRELGQQPTYKDICTLYGLTLSQLAYVLKCSPSALAQAIRGPHDVKRRTIKSPEAVLAELKQYNKDQLERLRAVTTREAIHNARRLPSTPERVAVVRRYIIKTQFSTAFLSTQMGLSDTALGKALKMERVSDHMMRLFNAYRKTHPATKNTPAARIARMDAFRQARGLTHTDFSLLFGMSPGWFHEVIRRTSIADYAWARFLVHQQDEAASPVPPPPQAPRALVTEVASPVPPPPTPTSTPTWLQYANYAALAGLGATLWHIATLVFR